MKPQSRIRALVIGSSEVSVETYRLASRRWHTWITGAIDPSWACLFVPSRTSELIATRLLTESVFETLPDRVFVLDWNYKIPSSLTDAFHFVAFRCHQIELESLRMSADLPTDSWGVYCRSVHPALQGTREQVLLRLPRYFSAMMRKIVNESIEPVETGDYDDDAA